MPHGTLFDETTAADLSGFTDILWTVAQRALGATQRPKYEVYQEETTNTPGAFWADVHVYQSGADQNVSYQFGGRSMPTPDMAIQMAAWEAIARLRRTIPSMDRRVFRFYPNGISAEDAVFASAQEEPDVAVVHLVKYLVAQHDMFVRMVDHLIMSRRALTLLHNQLPSNGNPLVTPARAPTAAEGRPPPGMPAVGIGASRRQPAADFLDLYAAHASSSRLAQRRRIAVTPQDSPVAAEPGSSREEAVAAAAAPSPPASGDVSNVEVVLSQPTGLDLNRVD